MAISDAEFAAWLAADNRIRSILVEAQCYSGSSTVTRYMSNRGLVSEPADSPANTVYNDIVVAVPRITRRMAEVFRGRSYITYGDIEIDNTDGARDSWLLDYWAGWPVVVYLGDPSWAKSDYRVIFSGVSEALTAQGNRMLLLRVRDAQYMLSVPVQTNRVGGTGPAKDTRLPVCYGEVKNVEPILIDAATRTYAVHDGRINSVDAVYMDGAVVTSSNYTVNTTAGTFSMSIAVTGRLTCDVKGSTTGGTYISKTGSIMQRMVMERVGLLSSDFDTAAISALDADAPGAVGIYITDDAATVLSALDTLASGVGGYFTFNRAGKFTTAVFKAPAGTPLITITDDDIVLGGLEQRQRLVPPKSVRLGYARNYTTMQSSAPTLTEADRQRLLIDYLVVYAATGVSGFARLVDGDILPSCFVSQSDATTEVNRRATLWGVLRRVFRFDCFLAPQQLNLGDVVALDFSRYGLSGGVLSRVVGIAESPTDSSVEIEVFL